MHPAQPQPEGLHRPQDPELSRCGCRANPGRATADGRDPRGEGVEVWFLPRQCTCICDYCMVYGNGNESRETFAYGEMGYKKKRKSKKMWQKLAGQTKGGNLNPTCEFLPEKRFPLKQSIQQPTNATDAKPTANTKLQTARRELFPGVKRRQL